MGGFMLTGGSILTHLDEIRAKSDQAHSVNSTDLWNALINTLY